MDINGELFRTQEAFRSFLTVPDCWVQNSNKIGSGNGEAKLYISSKDDMYSFFGPPGFTARCFMLKKDLVAYMVAIKDEYCNPSQTYRCKDQMPQLWNERFSKISILPDVIFFDVYDQNQIEGPRGYINSNQDGYKLIRELSLPLVSYIYIEKMITGHSTVFYWKLFVDFDMIYERKNGPLVFNYGRTNEEPKPASKKESDKEAEQKLVISKARDGQGKYREDLLAQCHFCPVTMVADERLLIASHIKPWAASNDKEKIDPYNGYMLSPLYDKLFDRGFITFTDNKHMILSDFISPYTWKLLGIVKNKPIKALPMDDKRVNYLKFHYQYVFKGTLPDSAVEEEIENYWDNAKAADTTKDSKYSPNDGSLSFDF